MKKSIVLAAAACFAISISFCQNGEKLPNEKTSKRKFRVADAAVLPALVIQNSPIGSLKDFQKMNPESELLKENMNGYSSSKGMMGSSGTQIGMGGFSGASFNADLGFAVGNNDNINDKSSAQLRVGISYCGIGMSNFINKTDIVRYDTLTSSQTGQTIYSDSLIHRSYNMNYKSQQLRIDVSIIYRTNTAARWSIYGGIGIEAGGAVSAFTDIDYSEYITIEPSNYTSSSYSSSHDRSERFVNKNSYGYAVYLPIGIDFRVGNKSEFFKQLHVFYEARPFINYTFIPELIGITGGGIKSGLGLRFTI